MRVWNSNGPKSDIHDGFPVCPCFGHPFHKGGRRCPIEIWVVQKPTVIYGHCMSSFRVRRCQLTIRRRWLYRPSQEALVQRPIEKGERSNFQILFDNPYRWEVIDKSDFGLRQMTHIGVTYFHRVPPPFVDLARGCSPHDIVKEHVAVGFAN